MEYSSHHPYSRNNGSMIPNRGYQQLVSFGFHAELGPLSIQFKPESVYAENRDFEGFPDSHYGMQLGPEDIVFGIILTYA
jgi:hypothetical protein